MYDFPLIKDLYNLVPHQNKLSNTTRATGINLFVFKRKNHQI